MLIGWKEVYDLDSVSGRADVIDELSGYDVGN